MKWDLPLIHHSTEIEELTKKANANNVMYQFTQAYYNEEREKQLRELEEKNRNLRKENEDIERENKAIQEKIEQNKKIGKLLEQALVEKKRIESLAAQGRISEAKKRELLTEIVNFAYQIDQIDEDINEN